MSTNRPLTPTPKSPEWVVTGDEVRKNEKIVLNGDLIIEIGGRLTLVNVTLLINCSYDGEHGIVVKNRWLLEDPQPIRYHRLQPFIPLLPPYRSCCSISDV